MQIKYVGANEFTGGKTWIEVPVSTGEHPLGYIAADKRTKCAPWLLDVFTVLPGCLMSSRRSCCSFVTCSANAPTELPAACLTVQPAVCCEGRTHAPLLGSQCATQRTGQLWSAC